MYSAAAAAVFLSCVCMHGDIISRVNRAENQIVFGILTLPPPLARRRFPHGNMFPFRACSSKTVARERERETTASYIHLGTITIITSELAGEGGREGGRKKKGEGGEPERL